MENILPTAPNKIENILPITQLMETTLPTVLQIVSYLQPQLLMQDELTSLGSTLFQLQEWRLDSYIRTSVSHVYKKHMPDFFKRDGHTWILFNEFITEQISITQAQ